MGSCISIASSAEIHAAVAAPVDYAHENVVQYQQDTSNKFRTVGSIFSHQGAKGLNQDSAILYQGYGNGNGNGMEDGDLCGVFDGHGSNGHFVSKLVRNRLPSLLLNQINASSNITSPTYNNNNNENFGNYWKEAFISAFKVMDKEVKLLENLDCSCSGTTAVVVLRQGENLIIANLGDSRAILATKTEDDGILPVQLTTDLKPGLPMEAERIRKCNGRVMALKEEAHIQRVWLPHQDSPGLAMSRAFGDFLLKNHGIIAIPDVSCHQLSPNDQFLVLATDGVWDVLNNEQVISIVSSAGNEEAAARAVVDASIAAWKKKFPNSKRDDSTVICLFLDKKTT